MFMFHFFRLGVRCNAFGWGTALQAGRSRFRFAIGSFGFFVDLVLTLRVDSAANRNEYQVSCLGGKGGR